LFRTEIPAFNEDAVREAILNAISHRDYRMAGSIFIRQSLPHALQLVVALARRRPIPTAVFL
jgi:hypothetical protein